MVFNKLSQKDNIKISRSVKLKIDAFLFFKLFKNCKYKYFEKYLEFKKMEESENKFKLIVKSSIEQAKEVHQIELTDEQISNIVDRIYINISNHLQENYTENSTDK